jgi:hypothetical protein
MPRCSLRCARVPSAQGRRSVAHAAGRAASRGEEGNSQTPWAFAASDSRRDERKLLARVAYHRS